MEKINPGMSSDSWMTAGAVVAVEIKPARIYNIQRYLSWNRRRKQFFCVSRVISQSGVQDVSKISLKFRTQLCHAEWKGVKGKISPECRGRSFAMRSMIGFTRGPYNGTRLSSICEPDGECSPCLSCCAPIQSRLWELPSDLCVYFVSRIHPAPRCDTSKWLAADNLILP